METMLLIAGTALAFCAAAVLLVLGYLALKLLGEMTREVFRPSGQIGPGHTPPRPLPRPATALTTITIGGIERCADCGRVLSMVPGRISDPVLAWPDFQHPCLGCPTCAARDQASGELPGFVADLPGGEADATGATGPNFVDVARCESCGTTQVLDINALTTGAIVDRIDRFHDRHYACVQRQRKKGK